MLGFLPLLLLAAGSCYGDTGRADHLLLLETLPRGVARDRATFLDIRTNFSGTVRVVESNEFRVVMNISALDLQSAYKVKADILPHGNGLLLHVREADAPVGILTLTWLGVAITAATFVVVAISSIYACCWYRSERSLYDPAERKSVAGSSQRGVYRSRNSLQVVNLPPMNDLPIPPHPLVLIGGFGGGEDGDGLQNDDSLKQVPEMPDEEEAEEFEMEELTMLKLKDSDASIGEGDVSNPHHILTSQERNLTKNHLGQSQGKNVHKELIRKDKAKQPARKRTANGLYTGVASGPEPGSADDSMESENDGDHDLPDFIARGLLTREGAVGKTGGARDNKPVREVKPLREGSRFNPEPSYENTQQSLRKPMTTFLSPQKNVRGQDFDHRGVTQADGPLYKGSVDYPDPPTPDAPGGLQVMADVHKNSTASRGDGGGALFQAPQNEIVAVTTPDKQTLPGFGGSSSPETPRPTLSTFASPQAHALAHPPARLSKAIRFKEPGEEAEEDRVKFPLPPPAVPAKPSLVARPVPAAFVTSSMDDIPEDPREDCDSLQSGRSRSQYGSSEIFDVNAPSHTYFNWEDSDIDILPLDADDFLSDSGLPSPLTASLGRSARTRDDSSLKGTRNAFFGKDGAGPSNVLKPRPYSSIVLRSDPARTNVRTPSDSGMSSGLSSDQAPVNSEADSGSPKLPPPPALSLDEQLGQDGLAFKFPPPPKFYTVPGKGSSGAALSPVPAGDYVTLSNNSVKAGSKDPANSRAETGRRGSGRLGFNSTFTTLTLLSVVTVLGLASGVVSKMTSQRENETRVDITVFAPASFLSAKPGTVFFNLHKDTELVVDANFNFTAYDSSNPALKENYPPGLCVTSKCPPEVSVCDVQTGDCLCRKGYRLTAESQCSDVNECSEGFTSCHPSAGCLNKKGSYECVCSVDYYGDGKTCHDCSTPCREDQYEVQPCSKTSQKQKICKDCTRVCHSGYYMASPCSQNDNALCRVCQPPCSDGQYEYRTCSNSHDRMCTNVTELPEVKASDNVIIEEDRKVKHSEVTVEHLRTMAVQYNRYTLKRGTGLEVEISLQLMEAAQQFSPLDLDLNNFSDSLPAALHSHAVQRFCPHPVPDHYILHYTKHVGVTYDADERGEVQPCSTYETHGTFPDEAAKRNNSFLCREPGLLTQLFEIPPDIFQTTTYWAQRTKRCESHIKNCSQCTKHCAQYMQTGSSSCNIVGDNNDNGWSPRLRLCYNCCARSNCTEDCRNHNRRRCQPAVCQVGTLIEFSVFPSWNTNHNKFLCHMRPVAKQRLLEMTYIIKHQGHRDPVHAAKVIVDGGEEWGKYGRTVHHDKLLTVTIDSNLGQLPDFLEGRFFGNKTEFSVGNYVTEGSSIGSTRVSGESLRIHPLKPFGVTIDKADPRKCNEEVLKDCVVTTDILPYRPNHDLLAVAVSNSTTTFVVTRLHQPPTIKITAREGPHGSRGSFLRGLFPWAVLKAESLTGKMTQNQTHWTVEVEGSVEHCPGYLRVVLSDPAYPATPLFSCDVGVTCPERFHLTFYLPTQDSLGQDRQVVASVADSKQVQHLRLHRPASTALEVDNDRVAASSAVPLAPAPMRQQDANEKTRTDVSLPQGFIFSIPYMVSLGGAIFLLLCLLIIGHIVQPGVPAPDAPILRCHHALFMVIYVAFQFIYSVIATASVFFLVIIAVNSARVTFIQQHGQKAAATSASQQLELTAMHSYAQKELERQDAKMDAMRRQCRKDMTLIVDDMKRMHAKAIQATEDAFQKHKLEMLLEEHRHRSLQQLAQDLLSFRDNYNRVVRTMLMELNHNIQQAQNSVENNTWLVGARYIHSLIVSTRKIINNLDSKPFMEWAHLQSDLSKLKVDVSFSLPSLPRLADLEALLKEENQRPIKRSKDSVTALHSTHIYNQWFSPFSRNMTGDGVKQSVFGSDTIGDRVDGSYFAFNVMLIVLACCDAVLLIHRLLKASMVGQMLLYGFPEYMDFRERKVSDEGDDDVFDEVQKCRCWSESPFCQAFKAFVSQLISATFVPKAVMVIAVVLLLRGMLHVSTNMLTVEFLQKAGLYHSSEEYLDLHSQLVNGRLTAHAHYINTIDFPAYQTWMSTYIQRHQFAFQVYRQQLERMKIVHSQSYCQYLQALELAGNCTSHTGTEDSQETLHSIISPGCQFQPVLPRLYRRSESVYQNLSEQQLRVMLENIRAVIFDTCQITVVFLSIVVVKELLSAVVWIFIRRSGLVRLRIIYETDQDEPASPTG